MRILVLLLVTCLFGCTTGDIEYPQSFPIVTTGYVTVITKDGAELSGGIASRGNGDPIVNYGFVWSPVKNPTLNSSKVVFNGNPNDAFSLVLTHGLSEGKYFVRAFVQTSKLTVYGNETNFKSQGSAPPVIESFTPAEGFDGTEVTLTLSNYTANSGTHVFLPGNLACETLTITDTEMKVKIPPSTFIGKYQLDLRTGVIRASTKGSFNILGPSITSLPKTTGIVGEHLVLGALYLDKATKIEIKFLPDDDAKFNIASTVLSPTEIDIQLPNRPGKTGRFQIESTTGNFTKVSILEKSFSITN